MQGKHYYQLPLFVAVDIEKLVPASHVLRRIDSIIDFSFIDDLVGDLYCLNKGRPSIDPILYFRMILIGYLYGIPSERKLCEDVGYNLAYRWFCRLSLEDTIPDHSSLTRTRDRFGEETFLKIFQKIIDQCVARGLVDGKVLITDATLIEADAAVSSMKVKKDCEFKAKKKNDRAGRKRISNDTHESQTDPDATLAKKPGNKRALRFKVHTSIDSSSRVILDCHVTTGATHDSTVYLDRVESVVEANPSLEIDTVVADRAYGTIENLAELERRNFQHYIPLFHSKTGVGARKDKNKGFRYDSDNDCYICPNGKKLTTNRKSYDGNKIRYAASGEDCKGCPLRDKCLNFNNKNCVRSKALMRSPFEALREKVMEKEGSRFFKFMGWERFWKVEGINAEAKNQHCLKRAKYRGRSKVQIQAYMTAITQNMKRLISVRGESSRNANAGRVKAECAAFFANY